MASQSFTPVSYAEFFTFLRVLWPSGNRAAINEELAGDGNTRLLVQLQVYQTGELRLTIAGSQVESDADAGDDLTTAFETSGSVTLSIGGNTFTAELAGADIEEPYDWTPTNSDEIIAFYNAVLGSSPSASDFTLTLDDGVVDQRIQANGESGVPSGSAQVRTTLAPDITISEWDQTGYQTPIVLAVVQATVTANFLTGVDVTPNEGELEVGSDLTIGPVERRSGGTVRLYGATGSTGRFDAYFDISGSPMYPDADLFLQTADDGVAKYDVLNSGNNANFSLDTGENSDVIANITTGDFFLLAIAEPQVAIQIAGDGESGVPAGTARVRLAVPRRIRGYEESGIPSGSARVQFTAPGATHIRGTGESGIPVGTARVQFIPPGATHIRGTDESGIPSGSARVRVTAPGATHVRGTDESGIPSGSARVRFTPPDLRIQATGESGVPTGTAQISIEEPPDIVIADWNGDDYQTPIILAVVQATVTANFLTVTNVTPNEGELEVGSDLTIGRVERRSGGTVRLYRATGSTARSDAYFNTSGSPTYPEAELIIQTTDDGVAKYDVSGSGNNANFSLGTGENADVSDNIVTGDFFLLAIAEPQIVIQVQGDGESGVPIGTARVRFTPPPTRIRGNADTGIPVGSARVHFTIPGASRIRGTDESGIPTGFARVRFTPPDLRIRGSTESGIPVGTGQVRLTVPGSTHIRGTDSSGIPVGTAHVRIAASVRVRGNVDTGIPIGTATVQFTAPGGTHVRGSAESGVPTGSAQVRIKRFLRIRGSVITVVPRGFARIRGIDVVQQEFIEFTPLKSKPIDIPAFEITITNSVRQIIVLTPVQAESSILTVWWSEQVNQWFFDLATEAGDPIVNGRGVIQRTFLVRAFSDLFQGDLYVTGPSVGEPPGRMGWAQNYKLYYIQPNSVLSLREQFPWL